MECKLEKQISNSRLLLLGSMKWLNNITMGGFLEQMIQAFIFGQLSTI